jgi:Zn-dependent peptidase ImmA (M78 family)
MIKIINENINNFITYLNNNYSIDQTAYVHICEGFDTIQEPETDNVAFGMFGNYNDHIYIAGDMPEEQVLKTIAHEYKHFIQKYSDAAFDENEAENFADMIYQEFMSTISINRKETKCTNMK